MSCLLAELKILDSDHLAGPDGGLRASNASSSCYRALPCCCALCPRTFHYPCWPLDRAHRRSKYVLAKCWIWAKGVSLKVYWADPKELCLCISVWLSGMR